MSVGFYLKQKGGYMRYVVTFFDPNDKTIEERRIIDEDEYRDILSWAILKERDPEIVADKYHSTSFTIHKIGKCTIDVS